MSLVVAHHDRPPFLGRPSLTGHNGHGWTCSLPRPAANDPSLPWALRRCHSIARNVTILPKRRKTMRRREFIAGLMIAAAMARAQAQQTGKVYRIAFAHPTVPVAEQ